MSYTLILDLASKRQLAHANAKLLLPEQNLMLKS